MWLICGVVRLVLDILLVGGDIFVVLCVLILAWCVTGCLVYWCVF